jgi:hypothetical protein
LVISRRAEAAQDPSRNHAMPPPLSPASYRPRNNRNERFRCKKHRGAQAALADALDDQVLIAAVRKAEPEVIIHQLTALTGAGNVKKFDEEFALTNRFRTEVTDALLAAARMAGTRRFIAQSYRLS